MPGCQPGTTTDFPCCTIDRLSCVLPPLPRWTRYAHITLACVPPPAFLVVMASRHPRRHFEACSVFTHVAARMTCWPPYEAFSRSASVHSLPPEPPLVLPAGARVRRVGLWRCRGFAFTDGSTVPYQGTHNNHAENQIRPLALGRNNVNCGFMRTLPRRRARFPSVRGFDCAVAASHDHSDCRNAISPLGGRYRSGLTAGGFSRARVRSFIARSASTYM